MKNSKGFSLIELMVVMVIFILVMGSVLGLLSVGEVSWQTGSSKITVTQELRRGMESMVKELSQAEISTLSLSDGVTSNSISFQMAQDLTDEGEPPDGTISFSSGELEGLRATDPSITYSLTYSASLGFSQLTKSVSGSSSVLANYLTDLEFTRNSNIVEISISGQKTSTFGRVLNGSLNGRVALRN